MKKITLKDILLGQDYAESSAEALANSAMNKEFDYEKDPISGIIANAFTSNNNCRTEDDMEEAMSNLDYAINQLKKARNRIFDATL